MSTIPPSAAHFEEAMRRAERGDPIQKNANRGLQLLAAYLSWASDQPPDVMGVNGVAALSSFTFAFHQLQGAVNLLLLGYYVGVAPLIRAAYEACSLGRHLAKNLRNAEKWLVDGNWIPDRDVRAWFGDADRSYARFYSAMCDATHPTARACCRLLQIADGEKVRLQLEPRLDAEWYDGLWQGIAGVVLWACFAVRNAAVDEAAIPPQWRQELSSLAHAAAPESDWSHLERNWALEREQWVLLTAATPTPQDTEDRVENDPRSSSNIRKRLDTKETET